jgi:dUTP pyrophosphatase
VSQTLQVQRVGPVEVPLPSYQSAGAAGLDLCAALEEPVVLVPGERRLVPTGIAVAIPAGHEGQVRPRSGIALRYGLGVVNAPGTIDADYRGEIGIVLINHGEGPVTIQPLSRIAQLVIAPVARVDVMAVDRLEPTARGPGGYGSTGE